MSAKHRSLDEVKTLIQGTEGFNSNQMAKFYDSWAPTYEQDINMLGYNLHPLLVDCLHANFSGNREAVQVLDVACGSGSVAKLMVELGFKNFVGVDCSKGMLEQAARLGIYQDLKLAVLGTNPLPAENGTFDVVILAGGLGEGFVPVSVLQELHNAAKPGGLIGLSKGAHSNSEGYTTDLDRELKRMVEEGLWSLVAAKELDRYMKDPYVNTDKEEERFIRGTAYTSCSSSGGILRRSQASQETVSPACRRSSPRPPTSGTCPEYLPRVASRRHPKQMPEPPQLTPVDEEEQQLRVEPLLNLVTELHL
ncbi:methyltransferase-like protein 27 [Antennarius striatus]|uniref:methyltransferase-like protein 27 n=1 Tax=Antennarius striatus TaxID=241820 RepID=UPI0035B4A77C